VDHIQEEKKTGEELLVFAILRYIYVYVCTQDSEDENHCTKNFFSLD
jgi:hypothetical protein